jgi:ATP-dependent helicase/nuclease subunit B
VHVRFLLGPAGSGKTCRCLGGVREALAARPDGPPLVFLAPKQATFQLERQLLTEGEIKGYTRLQILSFDRLATFVFQNLRLTPPEVLSAEGRLMVLRALLLRHGDELRLFRQSARRTGFAQQLATVLSELQQHQFTGTELHRLAHRDDLKPALREKLHDLALLRARYDSWLSTHQVQDAEHRLDLAVAALRQDDGKAGLLIDHLWLDGFAEMTPQEMDLLAAVMPHCRQATLAFCLENEPEARTSPLSPWSAIGKTFQQCRGRIPALPEYQVEVEMLPRRSEANRFSQNPALRHIEASWTSPAPVPGLAPGDSVALVACANPEAEAVYAARSILKFVRQGNRFRDCAVLVRQLDGYHQPLGRVFRRYGIPFFLDRRENVTHHPLAELTRSALRAVAFDWDHEDWFAALKAGFCPVPETTIDGLENAALQFGWQGKTWREPLAQPFWEEVRQRIVPPFDQFAAELEKLKLCPSGNQLAAIVRRLWDRLKVESALRKWSDEKEVPLPVNIHTTVWDQMNDWLDNVDRAFAGDAMSLRDWLPVLEAGLAGLTVGVIPPVLDEVLVGAIDRSRNPNLKFTLLLGVNELVFPATPPSPVILTTADRDELEKGNAPLGANLFDQLGRERYLGYIACTRSSEKLAVTFSRQGERALNPSPFIAHLQRMFEGLAIEEFSADGAEAEHLSELAPWLVGEPSRAGNEEFFAAIPALAEFRDRLRRLHEPKPGEMLAPALATALYGPQLQSSVSRLEDFAQCPFRFFVLSGLKAGERKRFELDARERGNFQHEILKTFHDELTAEGRRWRDLTTTEARERIRRIADGLVPGFRDGLLQTNARSAFAGRMLTEALQDFMETLVNWMHGQYEFDPAKAELDFGTKDAAIPGWKIELDPEHQLMLRGRIDRVDVYRQGERVFCVVMDYKSSARKLDKILLGHGIQLQLLGYLAAVRRWPADFFQAREVVPSGVFYVNLRGQFENTGSRTEALGNADKNRRMGYRHQGRFNAEHLAQLDRAGAADQFNYRLTTGGKLFGNSSEALRGEDFESLLDGVEEKLRTIGRRIFAGEAGVDPYRKGVATACEYCECQAVCRIDPWTHAWRVLRAVETGEESE